MPQNPQPVALQDPVQPQLDFHFSHMLSGLGNVIANCFLFLNGLFWFFCFQNTAHDFLLFTHICVISTFGSLQVLQSSWHIPPPTLPEEALPTFAFLAPRPNPFTVVPISCSMSYYSFPCLSPTPLSRLRGFGFTWSWTLQLIVSCPGAEI